MKWNNLFYSLLLLFLSVLCSPAPTVNFSSPPFNPNQFVVNQAANDISIKNSSNTVPIGIYPVSILNLTGTNYFSVSTLGGSNTWVLTISNSLPVWLPVSGSGATGTLTNGVYTNAGPSDTYVIGSTLYLKTNNFSGGSIPSNVLTNFDTRAWTNSASGVTNGFAGAVRMLKLISDGGMFFSDAAGNVSMRTLTTVFGINSAGNSFVVDSSGNVTATSFAGDGSALTSLNASQLTSGTVAVARLPVATTSTLGILRPDNTTITISGGIITAVGSSSTITNIAGGAGISVSQSGGTNFIAITGIVVTNCIYTNAGPNIVINNTLALNTNGFGGSGISGINTLNGFGTNTTLVSSSGNVSFTNYATGNGVGFDGTSFILYGINLNTSGVGSIGGNGAGLLHLNGSAVDNGTVSTAFLQANVVTNAAATNAGPPVVIGHTLVVPTNAAASTISATNIFPIVGTNTGPFNLLTLYGTGAVPAVDSASIAFDGTNIVATAIGTYAINGTHTNFYFFVPILYGSSNIAPYTQSSIFPTNNGTIYTNLPVRSVLQGALNLTTSVGSAATADIFWTNSGVPHFQEFSFPSGAANTYKISVNGIQLDPLATIRIVQASGTVSSTNLWLNNN